MNGYKNIIFIKTHLNCAMIIGETHILSTKAMIARLKSIKKKSSIGKF